MSLDTFENLKLEIIGWSHRDDLDLNIDTFIQLAETEMLGNRIEPLKLRSEESIATLTTSITTRFASLPTGYQSMRKIRIQITNGESYKLRFRTPEQLNILSDTGMPCFFTVTDQIEFDRVSDQVYTGEIQYFQEFTALSETNTTNSVLTSFPNVYLFGAMWALKKHVNEPQASQQYYSDFIDAIKGANKHDRLGRYGPAPRQTVHGPTP